MFVCSHEYVTHLTIGCGCYLRLCDIMFSKCVVENAGASQTFVIQVRCLKATGLNEAIKLTSDSESTHRSGAYLKQ